MILISQKTKLDTWIKTVLSKYFAQNGSFKVDEHNNLNEEDFFRIYDLIESVGRFELATLRNNNETKR